MPVAVVLLFLCRADVAAQEIGLGRSTASSGPSPGLVTEFYRGATACFEEVNRNRGVQGRKIRIVSYDDHYQPGEAINLTQSSGVRFGPIANHPGNTK
jgi:ABC-type branched-subunit amino acid transport system substrate-binding protein